MEHQPVYRPILRQAWTTASRHKKLWLLGVLAGIIQTGGVIDLLFTSLQRRAAVPTDDGLIAWLFRESVPGVTTLSTWAQKTALAGEPRLTVTIVILVIIGFILLYLGVAGQDALIRGLNKARPHQQLALPSLFRHGQGILLHLFTVGILGRLTMTAFLALAALALLALSSANPGENTFATFAVLLVAIPGVLAIGYLSVFAALEVSLKDKQVFAAIIAAAQVLKRHFVAVTEVAIALFFVNLLLSLALLAAIQLFAIPYLWAYRFILTLGSPALWVGAGIAGTLMLFILILAFMGFSVTFTYATWYEVYKKMARGGIKSKIERMIKQLSIVRK